MQDKASMLLRIMHCSTGCRRDIKVGRMSFLGTNLPNMPAAVSFSHSLFPGLNEPDATEVRRLGHGKTAYLTHSFSLSLELKCYFVSS